MATAEISGDLIEVITQWNERELIKQVPGARWAADTKTWTVPFTWASCVVLQGVFAKSTITFGEKLLAWGWRKRQDINVLLTLRGQIALDVNDPFAAVIKSW